MPPSVLVVGCSEQLPDDVRAYRLIGTSTDGTALLSRLGATYTAAPGDVSPYDETLARMLGLVLAGVPSLQRGRAREVLIRRWNRHWGVDAASPFEPLQATIEVDAFSAPRYALCAG